LLGCRCAQKLLREYAPGKLLPFMFKHGQVAAACKLLFPPAAGEADNTNDAHSADPITLK
jgi:hypothetical protein